MEEEEEEDKRMKKPKFNYILCHMDVVVTVLCRTQELVEGRVRGSVWRNIVKVGRSLDELGISFSDSFRWKLGSGESIRFWEDNWSSARKLRERFRRLYLLESVHSGKGALQGGVWTWTWEWRRDLRGRELGELEALYSELRGVLPRLGVRDKSVWKLDEINGFSVSKLRNLLEETRASLVNVVETSWLKAVPTKVNVFIWRLRFGRLPTWAVLDEMGVEVNSMLCPRCGEEVETVNHALFSCVKVRRFWKQVDRWWVIELQDLSTLTDLISAGAQRGNNSFGRARWEATIWSFLYFIWEDRNKLVFHSGKIPLTERLAFEWIMSRDSSFKLDMEAWLMDPFGH
ncbi:hypothetical protein OSB04_031592 [Centaurea solstitialis]|uniref:Reverse transcriptase zinc-binding domain-containing protein n=1 Tax=Centaurea solstitialis TaxID=347529 RepID=A0AA38S998_9ASTR|nr:hypothetical protein OSB04_031592 [Centaurea solstitialis]